MCYYTMEGDVMEMKEVFNVDEAAAYLGLNPDVLRRYARKGLIPCRKVGKRWRFHKTHLVEWLKGESKRGEEGHGDFS
jgi:excisionase family DNA binding protein